MLVREQFYGCEEKNIKGACQQVINGDNAFKVLNDVLASENGMERVLKPMFRGRQAVSAFIAGVDITVKMLSLYSSGKAYKCKTIWEMGSKVQQSVKKAMSLICS